MANLITKGLSSLKKNTLILKGLQAVSSFVGGSSGILYPDFLKWMGSTRKFRRQTLVMAGTKGFSSKTTKIVKGTKSVNKKNKLEVSGSKKIITESIIGCTGSKRLLTESKLGCIGSRRIKLSETKQLCGKRDFSILLEVLEII